MHRLTNKEKSLIEELYRQGKMDSEISRILGINRGTICYYRNSHNMPSKFTYDKVSKIDSDSFKELFNKGLSDYKIAEILGMSPDGIYSYRMRHDYIRKSLKENKEISLSEFQKEVLIGTLLGDASLRCTNINPFISCGHGNKQKSYCEHKTRIFESIGAKCLYSKRHTEDPRTGIKYESYTMRTPANPALIEWYKAFYPTNIKVIPFSLFNYFTEVSLAYLYMDDGSKTQNSYVIATNCFTIEELNRFRVFLLEKFKLETSMFKTHALYIKAASAEHFKELIQPYIIESMQYKLH